MCNMLDLRIISRISKYYLRKELQNLTPWVSIFINNNDNHYHLDLPLLFI